MSGEVEMTYRIYFNRKNADRGLVWSVDSGDQSSEVNVKRIVVRGCRTYTDGGPGDNETSPTVWLVVEGGRLTIIEDVAYITT